MQESENSCNNIVQKLTIEQRKYAAQVLNETDENRENAIAEIKHWIQDSDLRARTDDFFILRFLRACKFNNEKTKTKIENYQKQRANVPEWFKNRDPLQPKLQELLDVGICLPLRKLDDHGRLIFIARFSYDTHKFTLPEAIKVSTMAIDLALRDSVESSLYGVAFILDFAGATFRHITQVTPSILINMVHGWQGCYPIRIQSLNYINIPEYAKFIIECVRYFLNKKLRERLHVYSQKTTHDCFKDIPADILPVEYGGTDGTIEELKEYWKEMIEKNREWFIEDEQYIPVSKK